MSAKVIKAWVAQAAKRALALEIGGLESLGAKDPEIAVERRGLSQAELSVLQSWSKSVSSRVRTVWTHSSNQRRTRPR